MADQGKCGAIWLNGMKSNFKARLKSCQTEGKVNTDLKNWKNNRYIGRFSMLTAIIAGLLTLS